MFKTKQLSFMLTFHVVLTHCPNYLFILFIYPCILMTNDICNSGKMKLLP